MAIGLALVSWAFARVGVHRLSLRLPYLSIVPLPRLHLPLDFIRVSSLRPTCLHPIRSEQDVWAPPFGRRRLGAGVWAPPFGRTAVWAPDVWAPALMREEI